jgi:aspartate aminotransferase-like enzyme/GNAT superfamily N-acetyltransferase
MRDERKLVFKVATEQEELDQIHELNYRTFVEEIPQHAPNQERMLVDKFHSENTYVICRRGDELLGMVAVKESRPFSLDAKLDNLDSYLPEAKSVCEVRLLSVEKEHRRGRIFAGLLRHVSEYCHRQGHDLAIISGTVRQLRLYRHMGFVPFGPLVGTGDALYQPMYLTLSTFEEKLRDLSRLLSDPVRARSWVNLLPGPVHIRDDVRKEFSSEPVSHRSEEFVRDFQETKALLCGLVGAQQAEIMVGSGTLANDAVAAQLSILDGPGIVLANGEFGERLVDQATRAGLEFKVVRAEWGRPFAPEAIEAALARQPDTEWLWAVHCETSTSILNDMDTLKALCNEHDVRLCLDCISSIGTLPVDLSGVYLATGVSGKALGAFPGLSMVFYNHPVSPQPTRLPRYLDLGYYAAKDGVPFTHSSNLMYALRSAVKRIAGGASFDELAAVSSRLRDELEKMGFHLIGTGGHASPAVITIALPENLSSETVGSRLQDAGFLLSYRSSYLLERNWIQICLMGASCNWETVKPLLGVLADVCSWVLIPTGGDS